MPQFRTGIQRDAKSPTMTWILIVAALLNGIVVLEYGFYSVVITWGLRGAKNAPLSAPGDTPEEIAKEEAKRSKVIELVEQAIIGAASLAVSHAVLAVCLFLLPRRNMVSLIITTGVCGWLFVLYWLGESDLLDWEPLIVLCSVGVAIAARFVPDDDGGQPRKRKP